MVAALEQKFHLLIELKLLELYNVNMLPGTLCVCVCVCVWTGED